MEDRARTLQLLQKMKNELNSWYASSQGEIDTVHTKLSEKLESVRRTLMDQTLLHHRQRNAEVTPRKQIEEERKISAGTPPPASAASATDTPIGSPQSSDKVPLDQLLSRFAQANNSLPLNFDSIYEQLANENVKEKENTAAPTHNPSIPIDSLAPLSGQYVTTGLQLVHSDSGRPIVSRIGNGTVDDPSKWNIDSTSRCQVLVEFKRKRVLQYESRCYVGPGEYVAVGGDRGEDLGLVIYTWCETKSGTVQGIGLAGSSLTKNIGVGSGKVLRVANTFEISQLHGIQNELERRAVEVCQNRVLEHGLPMVIVDAEYQFDKKKLTFFYEAQQRLDFRELVRDLFKTFRARIWMELVEV